MLLIAEQIQLNLDSKFESHNLYKDVSLLLNKFPIVKRSAAVGGWALQSTDGRYQDGWDLEFCPYNGPENNSPSWTPQNDEEKKLRPVQSYEKPTEIMTPLFFELICRLEELGLNPRKARIIKLAAHSESTWHQDGAAKYYQVRLHIPLVTHDQCFFENRDGRIHMALDKAYLVHINKPHRILNLGSEDRYHFVCHAWDIKNISQHHRYNSSENEGETTHPVSGPQNDE
jgi:hypothetical protein